MKRFKQALIITHISVMLHHTNNNICITWLTYSYALAFIFKCKKATHMLK